MSSLLSRRAWRATAAAKKAPILVEVELPVPPEFRCPISLDLMRDPVTGPTGITYDRSGIEAWLLAGGGVRGTCPVTHGELRAEDLVPNHALRRVIQAWCVANRSRGVERIPTPRVPVTAAQAAEALAEVADAARAGDGALCAAATRGVRSLAREAERDRRCFAAAGAGRVLASVLASFAIESSVLDDVLSTLVLVMPLDQEAITAIASSSATMEWLVALAGHGDLQRRLQAVVVIKEVVLCSCACDGDAIDLSANIEGIIEVLVKTIRDPICPQTTKASLVAAYHLAHTNEHGAARLAAAGLIPLLVELIVDGDRSTAEKALAALEATLVSEDGRTRARANELAVPVLVKKMLRVSDTATELVVSALWFICKGCRDEEDTARQRSIVMVALQVGAFQKLLLLLQVGCREATKEKATELLRLMSKHQSGGGNCIDTVDLRGLERRP